MYEHLDRMESYNLDEIAAEFQSDTDIVKLITSVKDARKQYQSAKDQCDREEKKRKQTEELLLRKRRKLLQLTLSKELSKLEEDIQTEKAKESTERIERESLEKEISILDDSEYRYIIDHILKASDIKYGHCSNFFKKIILFFRNNGNVSEVYKIYQL